jgi:hypothetical protein
LEGGVVDNRMPVILDSVERLNSPMHI